MVNRKMYLGEIIKRDKLQLGNNNMFLAPVGSGKSHYILNQLHNKGDNALMLVSTTSLKESLLATGKFHTTSEVDQADSDSILLMTYSEFGDIIAFSDDNAKDYTSIYCDEIHSLFDYFSYNSSFKLAAAIKFLFKAHEHTKIYYFTATIDKIEEFANRNYKGVLDKVRIYDYSEHKDIVKYTNAFKEEFFDVYGMMDIIDKLEDFGCNGEKGVIFNERIDGMKRIEELLVAKGYKVATIWSVNNDKHHMSAEQLRVRKQLLEEGIISEGYDFLIINGSMREGWNLLDEKVELVILNTKDATDRIQARGRVRKNISMIAIRVDGETPIELKIMRRNESLGAIQSLLGREITAEDKEELARTLGVKRDNGQLVKWNAISEAIQNNGYEVTDKRVRRDGKQLRVSVITKR